MEFIGDVPHETGIFGKQLDVTLIASIEKNRTILSVSWIRIVDQITELKISEHTEKTI